MEFNTRTSLQPILDFARSKPADEPYEYWNTRECALAQVSKHLFPDQQDHWGGATGFGYFDADKRSVDFDLGPRHTDAFWNVASGEDDRDLPLHTWGKFADRLATAMETLDV